MIDSFMDLVSESAEITEMGVSSVSRLTGSELAGVRKFSQDLSRLISLIRAAKSSDIIMERAGAERRYYPRFRNPEIIQAMQTLKSYSENRFLSTVGKWKDIYPNDDDAIYMRTDAPDSHQRSHFPNDGIPVSLRGTKLGTKLYRALVRTAGYISSNTAGTREKDNVWASMLETKRDANGNPTEEDVHAIIGPSNWMALDKNLDRTTKMTAAMRFISDKIRFERTGPEQFDMDDELFQQLPEDFLSNLDSSYLRTLVDDGRITREKYDSVRNARANAERAARERADREEVEARERAAREEQSIRNRLIARIARFGADPDAEWNVGDFIVVKNYLYRDNYDPLPIREVAAYRNGVYYALTIREMIRVRNNEVDPVNANNNRTTRDKSIWVKVNLNEIPDLDNVNLNREEKKYIEAKLSPETADRRQETVRRAEQQRAQSQITQNADRANNPATYGFAPSSATSIKDALLNRPNLDDYRLLLKAFKNETFYRTLNFIVLGPTQIALMRQSWAIPVYIPWIGHMSRPIPATLEDLHNGEARLTNAVSGEMIEPPFIGLNLTAYQLSNVTVADKIGSRAHDYFYIAGHQNTYGVIAKSQYGAVNTSRQKFIYLHVYGYAGRSVSVRLDLLKKLGAPVTI